MVELHGYQPKFVDRSERVDDAIRQERPGAVLIDCDHQDCTEALIETIRRLDATTILFSPFRMQHEVLRLRLLVLTWPGFLSRLRNGTRIFRAFLQVTLVQLVQVLIFVAELLIRGHCILLKLPVRLHAPSRGMRASDVHEACPRTPHFGADDLLTNPI